jgi:iron complex outermembrane recepter protein
MTMLNAIKRRSSRLADGRLRFTLIAALVPLGVSAPAMAAPATSQPTSSDAAAAAAKPVKVRSLTVTAARLPYAMQPGAVVGDITPELQLDPSDIQSFGVSTITELLNELAPQTRSDRGRTQQSPVVLLNGRRISSLNEIQNIPTEAILRIDILPEEVALKYGYTADQRVINIVLKPLFHAVTTEVVGGETTEGGDATGQAEVDQFNVDHDQRLNLDLKYQRAAGLTDAQRGIPGALGGAPFALDGNVVSATPGAPIDPAFSALVGQPVTVAGVPPGVAADQALTLADFAPFAAKPNVTDTANDYSLAPATQALTANAVIARPMVAGINATFNVTLGGTTSSSLQGLPGLSLLVPAGDPFSPFASPVMVDRYLPGEAPLQQNIDGWTAHLGATFNRNAGDWRLSLTTAYNHADTITETGTGFDAAGLQALLNQGSTSLNPFGPLSDAQAPLLPFNSARLSTNGGNIQILGNGPTFKLPAGAIYVSAKLGDSIAMADSSSRNADLFQAQTLTRNDVSGLLNVEFPIASRTNQVLAPLGDLSFNVNSAVDYLSDFGLLPTLGLVLNWTPIPGYNLIISQTHDHQAPTIQQLDGPVVETPGTRIFDYESGQTVAVTQISGGNRALTADDRNVIKIGLTLKPFATQDFTVTANYIDSRIVNAIATFPSASAAIEAAFPDRFIRNDDGELTQEDDRPVNFAREDREELRWGVNYTRPVGKQPTRAYGRRDFRRRPGGQGGRGQGFGGPGGPGAFPAGDQGPGGPPGDAGPDAQSGSPPPAPGIGDSGAGPGGGPGGRFGGGGFGGGGFGGFGGRGGRGGGGDGAPTGGRLQLALYHTIYFKDQYLVNRGGPVLDLLNGAAAGGTGGQYQHEIEAQLGYTDNGYGARLSADWRSATTVIGGAAGGTGTLSFSDIATVNVRFWDDFTPQRALVERFPLLRGVRATFSVTNLFNQSIDVRSSSGPTPLIYQAAFLNPTGRVISINLRKLFD